MQRILICPGSAVDSPPDEDSAAAKEGTFAHTLGERMLRGEEVEFPNDEMRQAVFAYVAYVKAFRSHDELEGVDHTNSVMQLEERIVSKLIPDHGGTMDALIVSDTHIHVNDFKYGVMPVSGFNNKQLLSYLALADEQYPGRKRFFGSIIQPRVYGTPNCVEYTREQLDQHVLDIMLTAGDDTREAGEHCRWCPLKKSCPVMARRLAKLAQADFDDGWSSDQCKEVIEMAGVVKTLAEDAKQHLVKLMKQGEKVDGWKLARQIGNRCWRDEAELDALCTSKQISTEALYIKKIRSPTQLEKFSKAYRPLVATHAHRPVKGIIAVTVDSKLPEYDPTSVFSDPA